MNQVNSRLELYPQLASWYSENKYQPPSPSDHIAHLMWSTCHALSHEDLKLLPLFGKALKGFCDKTGTADKDFQQVEKMFSQGGLNFMELTTELAELAIRLSHGTAYFELMRQVADKTHLAIFRFIAAWTALNLNDLKLCVEECEKIDEPFACVYTIHGQALLELGYPEQAIEILEVATSLSPKEILTQFQLTKAYHVTDQLEKAWASVKKCQNIEQHNEEVSAMMAIIALTKRDNIEWLEASWNHLSSHMHYDQYNLTMLTIMCDIGFCLKKKERLAPLIEKTNWTLYKNDQAFMQKLSWLLKQLDELKWNDLASILLTKLLDEKKTAQ
jgi:hypothetical protein